MNSEDMKTSSITDPCSEFSIEATISDNSLYQDSILDDNDCVLDESGIIDRGEPIQAKSIQTASLLRIYTEWANHYLEKAGFTTFVNDLQADLCDGVLLADVILAVTGEKLSITRSKTKSATHQFENVNLCLSFLTNIGVIIEGILPKDIVDGNLKSILSLLFNLSRYKQQLKRQSSTASTPSAISSNGSTVSGNNNMHKLNSRATILKTSTTGIPSLSHSPKTVTLRLAEGILTPKKSSNNNNNTDGLTDSPLAKRGSTAKSKPLDFTSSNCTLSSTTSHSGIPLPSSVTITSNIKKTSLTKSSANKNPNKHSTSANNSPCSRTLPEVIVEPNEIMFDRFKLFRNSANEKINNKTAYPGFTTVEFNGSNFMSEPLRPRSMTPCDTRMSTQYNPNVCPITILSQDQYPSFTATSSNRITQPHQSQSPQFQSYSNSVDNQRLIPMHGAPSTQPSSNIQRVSNETRKSRTKDNESSRKDVTVPEPSAHSINRYERQKAKELYAALKQRDRTKFNNSPRKQEHQDPVLQKPMKMMSSHEFTQMIQNDPRLKQYVDNKNKPQIPMETSHSLNNRTNSNSRNNKPESRNIFPVTQTSLDSYDSIGLKATNYEKSNKKKPVSSKSQPTAAPEQSGPPQWHQQSPSATSTREPQSWNYQSTTSGTDSDYANYYASMRKYASDFESSIDLESSIELVTHTERKFGYYSDSDSVVNAKFERKESGTNTDLSNLVNQKLLGLRKFMNTSGVDPANYVAYQKNISTSKAPSSHSADKDRIYGIVNNAHTARTSAGPTAATLDDFQPQSSTSLTQPYIRSNSSRYADVKSKDKTFPQSIKLPYATNSDNYIIKLDQVDTAQNIGSNLSLASNDSCRSMTEEKQAQEVRKLRQELEIAQQKVVTLSSRLSTNAHMASAFELSLMNMTERLQRLTETSEKKDHELLALRTIIESLKQHSNIAQVSTNNGETFTEKIVPQMLGRSYSATASPTHYRNSFDQSKGNERENKMSGFDSTSGAGLITASGSCNSLNSTEVNADIDGDIMKKEQKKGWFRSSLGKAFRKKPKIPELSVSDVETDFLPLHSVRSNQGNKLNFLGETSTMTIENLKQQLEERDLKLTDAQLEALSSAHQLEQLKELLNAMRHEMSTLRADNERLQKMIPIDGSLNEHMLFVNGDNNYCDQNDGKSFGYRNKSVDSNLVNNNEILNHLFKFSSPNETSIGTFVYINDSTVNASGTQHTAKKVTLGSCHISDHVTWPHLETQIKALFKEYLTFIDPISNLGISVDCIESYSLGSITHQLAKDVENSDTCIMSPLEAIGGVSSATENIEMKITIRNSNSQNSLLDALAFDTLIPKTVLQRYVSLLLEHRLIILCGPSGTGKSYLASKLAKLLILRHGEDVSLDNFATFTVDQKSNKELKTYLSSIADHSQTYANGGHGNEVGSDRGRKLPLVVVLDNLHHVNSLAEIFDSFLTSNLQNCPYVIGTMTQASFSNTNLQTHHNFRWVLCANHMEPVKGFLGRYLRRKLIQIECIEVKHDETLLNTVDWIPKVWQHINKFLESHSSSDVTIGPRLFLSCPMSIEGSQIWFTDLWNYSLVPYLLEAVREGLQTFGRRSKWEDPVNWILQTWPWISSKVRTRNSDPSSLIRLRPEDVGYDSQVPFNVSMTSSPSRMSAQNMQMMSHVTNASFGQDSRINLLSSAITQRTTSHHNTFPRADPVYNMLMKLQDAATDSTDYGRSVTENGTTRSNSLTRVTSPTTSLTQITHINKVFKTDIL